MRLLSPSVLIYKMPFNALLSIAHRATGVVLYMVLIISLWFVSCYLLVGQEASFFTACSRVMHGICGRVFVALVGLMLSFHLFNGARYIVNDFFVGRLFDKRMTCITACVMLLLTLMSGIVIAAKVIL